MTHHNRGTALLPPAELHQPLATQQINRWQHSKSQVSCSISQPAGQCSSGHVHRHQHKRVVDDKCDDRGKRLGV
jgi:hypothetical protein